MSRRKRQKEVPAPLPAASQHGPDLPYWLPSGDYWDGLPREIRDAVPRILGPAYRKFVLEAGGELERSLGLTLVHLIWLEVCDHVRMALAAADSLSLAAALNDPDAMIARHLNLITAKCQTAELLVKLRLVTEALNAPPALPAPFATAAGGEDKSLPSPFGRGAGGEVPAVLPLTPTDPAPIPSFPVPIETPTNEV
jgi:hypothetical protein